MKQIKVQKVIGFKTDNYGVIYKEPPLANKCFFDAGEFDFAFDSSSPETHYFNKNGVEIFRSTMYPTKVYSWGSVGVRVLEKSAFDVNLDEYYYELICFDPRIIMIQTLLAWVLENDKFDKDLYNSKELTDLLHPIPTMEEAKVFLRKKDLLTEEPILYASMDPQRPLDNLDVPEKIRAYIRNLKLQDGD